jgi:hypothetical protein
MPYLYRIVMTNGKWRISSIGMAIIHFNKLSNQTIEALDANWWSAHLKQIALVKFIDKATVDWENRRPSKREKGVRTWLIIIIQPLRVGWRSGWLVLSALNHCTKARTLPVCHCEEARRRIFDEALCSWLVHISSVHKISNWSRFALSSIFFCR